MHARSAGARAVLAAVRGARDVISARQSAADHCSQHSCLKNKSDIESDFLMNFTGVSNTQKTSKSIEYQNIKTVVSLICLTFAESSHDQVHKKLCESFNA